MAAMVTQKEMVRVVIYTPNYWIEGNMYILPGSRLTDLINVKTKDFFPLTDAQVIDPKDKSVLYAAKYLALNRDSIIMVIPKEDITTS